MKDNEKKVKAAEEAKEEKKTEEKGVELTDEELSSVAAGTVHPDPGSNPQPSGSPESLLPDWEWVSESPQG